MKKVLFFKKSATECIGFAADRLIGAYRSNDTTLNFYFDDLENTISKHSRVELTIEKDDENSVKEYLEKLVEEISYGKSPVIKVYDEAEDSGFGDAKAMFSAITITVANG